MIEAVAWFMIIIVNALGVCSLVALSVLFVIAALNGHARNE